MSSFPFFSFSRQGKLKQIHRINNGRHYQRNCIRGQFHPHILSGSMRELDRDLRVQRSATDDQFNGISHLLSGNHRPYSKYIQPYVIYLLAFGWFP